MLPFTIKQFLYVFALYNQAVAPAQFVLLSLAVIALVLAIRPRATSTRIIWMTLALLWLWTGLVYHMMFFTMINGVADYFGLVFILQAVLFVLAGAKARLDFSAPASAHKVLGAVVVAYALVIYPLLGYLAGHVYPYAPTFGAPCPMVIFTFGMLLWSARRPPIYLYVIPLLWSVMGLSAALMLGMYEDIGLFVAGVIGVTALGVGTRAKEYIASRLGRSGASIPTIHHP